MVKIKTLKKDESIGVKKEHALKCNSSTLDDTYSFFLYVQFWVWNVNVQFIIIVKWNLNPAHFSYYESDFVFSLV